MRTILVSLFASASLISMTAIAAGNTGMLRPPQKQEVQQTEAIEKGMSVAAEQHVPVPKVSSWARPL